MRVAVNAEQLLYRSPGGVGRYTAQLLTLVPGRRPDCEVVPFGALHRKATARDELSRWGVDPDTAARWAAQPLPAPLLYSAWGRYRVPPLVGIGPVDVVHAPSVAVPPRPRSAALAVTVHDAAPELFPGAFTERGLRFHRRGLEAAAAADVVITVSQAAADEISALTRIPAERLRVVHNAVDPPPPRPAGDDREALARLGLPDRPLVLWVGSLEPRKGVGTLLGAMAALRREGRDGGSATVLAGYRGWLQEGLTDPGDVAALGDRLVRLGRVSEADLWALYRAATVFAFPSRHEGFGLPPLEAMTQGTAVVASDIAVLRETLGSAARLVEPERVDLWADAIGDLVADERARRELGRAGQERSRRFGPDAMAAGTWAVYQEIGS